MRWGGLNNAPRSYSHTVDFITAVGFDALISGRSGVGLHVHPSARARGASPPPAPGPPLSPSFSLAQPGRGKDCYTSCTEFWIEPPPLVLCVSKALPLLRLFPPLWNWVMLYLVGGCEVQLGWGMRIYTNGTELTRMRGAGTSALPPFTQTPWLHAPVLSCIVTSGELSHSLFGWRVWVLTSDIWSQGRKYWFGTQRAYCLSLGAEKQENEDTNPATRQDKTDLISTVVSTQVRLKLPKEHGDQVTL